MYANAVLLGAHRAAPARLGARARALRPHHGLRAGRDGDDALPARPVPRPPLVPPRLLARRLRRARRDRARGRRVAGAPARRAAAGGAPDDAPAARRRRRRGRRDGRRRARAARQPRPLQRRLAVGGRPAHRPPARRLARRVRRRLRVGAVGRRLAPRPPALPRRAGHGRAAGARPAPPPGRPARRTPAGELAVYYALALLVAAPGAALLARPRAARPRGAWRGSGHDRGAGAPPDDARRARRAARHRGRDLPARPLALPRPDGDRPALRVDDQGAADRRLPRRELLGLDDARARLRRRARVGPRAGVRAART